MLAMAIENMYNKNIDYLFSNIIISESTTMKRFLAIALVILMLASLGSCGEKSETDTLTDGSAASASDNTGADVTENHEAADAAYADLTSVFEMAVTEPHYYISTPDWHAEGYGCGFALTENGSSDYAIVAACGYGDEEGELDEVFSALYNDNFRGILMQNYRAVYAEFTPAVAETKLADGTPALLFNDVQTADDYGTDLSCPVYGYGFIHDGVPFIIAYIVMNESAVDDAKLAEMQGYVDEMVNTVRAVQ